MARDESRLPPPTGKGRKGPEMMDEDPSIVGKLSQLAGQRGVGEQGMMGGMGGGMGGEGGNEEQSASLLMSGAQQLMQAAQMNPALQQFVGQAIQIIQQGVQQLAGAGAGGEPPMGGGRAGGGRKRMRPPQKEARGENEGAGEDQFSY